MVAVIASGAPRTPTSAAGASHAAITRDEPLGLLPDIFEQLADGVLVVKVVEGAELELELVNAKAAEWLRGSAQARGERLSALLSPAQAARTLGFYRLCSESGESQRFDDLVLQAQPEMAFQTTLIPLREGGRVARIVSILRDVTEQRLAARALSESQEMLAKAFRYAPYAMLILRSSDGAYVDVNAAFEQLFECERSAVVDSTSSTAVTLWVDQAERERLLETMRRDGRVRDFASRLRTFKGDLRDVLISSDLVMLGGEAHIISNVRDVTKTMATERTKAELEAQLRQAQKLEALGTLAGGIAHDFNNILGAMVAFIDLIRLDVNDRMAVLAHVGELKTAAQRARDLVQQILTFSRVQQPSRSVTKLDLAVREAVKLLRSSLPSSVRIHASFDERAPAVLADASQVHQVVMNLGTNAGHAMRERGGELLLGVDALIVDEELSRRRPDLRPGRYARMLVKDTGAGMDETTLKRIFEPFFTTKKPGEGTGLGLAVVHGIVRDHDGAITVESRRGVGTTFEIFFPEHIGEPVVAQAGPAQLIKGQGERLLVVDDEEALCVSLSHLLQRLGYVVVAKSRPEEALELYRAQPGAFALVLTDLTMPGMTGLQLAEQILKTEPRAKVALMSGFSGTWTPASVRLLGLVEMLVKPLSAAALAEGIARALANPR